MASQTAYGSYNHRSANVVRDSAIVGYCNSAASIFAVRVPLVQCSCSCGFTR